MKKSLSSTFEITSKSKPASSQPKTSTGKTSTMRQVTHVQSGTYSEQLQQIRRLNRSILKITPSSSTRELESYKAQMHCLFSFIEEEKAALDRSANTQPIKVVSAALHKEEFGLSDEIDRLKSEALMAGVEADLQADQLIGDEQDGFRETTRRERVYRCYKTYNGLLENLLKKCRAYKLLLEARS